MIVTFQFIDVYGKKKLSHFLQFFYYYTMYRTGLGVRKKFTSFNFICYMKKFM